MNEQIDFFNFTKPIASYKYNGEYRPLIPAQMQRKNNVLYEQTEDGLLVELVFTNLPHQTWLMRFTNISDKKTLQISEINTLDVSLTSKHETSLHTLRGDNYSEKSFMPIDKILVDNEKFTVCPNGGRPSCTTGFPFFDVSDGESAYLIALGWTGQWQYSLETSDGNIHINAGVKHADFYLLPGETVRGISVFLLNGNNPVSLRRKFRQTMLNDFCPVANRGADFTLPISIQPFDRYFYGLCERWPTTEGQIETLKNAKKCEFIDTFWIDAAWFKNGFPHGVGNYSFTDGFKNGLRPVADAVHEQGMNFMVWFEPERVYEGSELYENHPEFLLSCEKDPKTKLYNLGDEDAWNWMFNTLKNFISDNAIDNYRQDFNIEPLQYWLENDEDGRTGINEMKYVESLYRLWDALKKEFPGLIIDNCASGGRRIDFETIKRAVVMWRSDVDCFPSDEEKHRYVWDQNEILAVSEYLPFHAGASWVTKAYEVRSTMTDGLACSYDILNPDFEFDFAKKGLEEIHRLGMHWRGDFYPLTQPTLSEKGWAAYQLAGEKSGFAVFFRRGECTSSVEVFSLNSIDSNCSYKLTFSDEYYNKTQAIVDGKTLANGLDIEIKDVNNSLVLEYEKI